MTTYDMPRFITELEKGNPVYIYLIDGEYVHAVKLLNLNLQMGIIDVKDEEGDWASIIVSNITNSIAVK